MARDDTNQAGAWITAAIGHADAAHATDRSKVDFPQLDVLWLAAELVPRNVRVGVPLGKRLVGAQDSLLDDGRPSARTYERWFEVYSALVP